MSELKEGTESKKNQEMIKPIFTTEKEALLHLNSKENIRYVFRESSLGKDTNKKFVKPIYAIHIKGNPNPYLVQVDDKGFHVLFQNKEGVLSITETFSTLQDYLASPTFFKIENGYFYPPKPEDWSNIASNVQNEILQHSKPGEYRITAGGLKDELLMIGKAENGTVESFSFYINKDGGIDVPEQIEKALPKKSYANILEFKQAIQQHLLNPTQLRHVKKSLESAPSGQFKIINIESSPNILIVGKGSDGKILQFRAEKQKDGSYFVPIQPDVGINYAYYVSNTKTLEQQIQYRLNPPQLPKNLTELKERIDKNKKGKKPEEDLTLFTFDFDQTLVNIHWHSYLIRFGQQGSHNPDIIKNYLEKLQLKEDYGFKNKDILISTFKQILSNPKARLAITSTSKFPDSIKQALDSMSLTAEQRARIYYRVPVLGVPAPEKEDEASSNRVKDVLDAMEHFNIADPSRVVHTDDFLPNLRRLEEELPGVKTIPVEDKPNPEGARHLVEVQKHLSAIKTEIKDRKESGQISTHSAESTDAESLRRQTTFIWNEHSSTRQRSQAISARPGVNTRPDNTPTDKTPPKHKTPNQQG